ncbi:MAG: gas vesicle protein GvpG [Pseudomonadota bacterium]
MNDPATLKARLAHLEKLLLSEQITEDEFEALELEILTRLRDIQRAGGPKGGAR